MIRLMACMLLFFASIQLGSAQGWFEDFEGSDPTYGFELLDRGGDLETTESFQTVSGDEGFLGSTSIYFETPWDMAQRETGIEDGLISVWFYDTAYYGPQSTAIRLRTELDSDIENWPLDFTAVDIKGRQTSLGEEPIQNYYVVRPDEEASGMGLWFGDDIISQARIPRATEAWNEATFCTIDGKTYTSINGYHSDCVNESKLPLLQLLCRSGWYPTRGGESKIMVWDDICVMPKLNATTFDGIPDWMESVNAAGIVGSASPGEGFVFLPGAENTLSLQSPDTELSCPWAVDRGTIEVWFWDTNTSTPGYKTEIQVANTANPDEWIEFLHYSVVMNNVADSYYIKTHDSTRGSSFKVPRREGWHRLVFRKVKNELRLSVDGVMGDGEKFVWNDPPSHLTFKIKSGDSNYIMGSGLWLGRLTLAGDAATDVSDWRLR